MAKKRKIKKDVDVPAVIDEHIPARIDPSELDYARKTSEQIVRWTRNSTGGFLYDGQVLPGDITGWPHEITTKWKLYDEDSGELLDEQLFDGDLEARPGTDYKLRSELVLRTTDNFLIGVGFPESSYKHNLSPFLSDIGNRGERLEEVFVRVWCERGPGKQAYPAVKISRMSDPH